MGKKKGGGGSGWAGGKKDSEDFAEDFTFAGDKSSARGGSAAARGAARGGRGGSSSTRGRGGATNSSGGRPKKLEDDLPFSFASDKQKPQGQKAPRTMAQQEASAGGWVPVGKKKLRQMGGKVKAQADKVIGDIVVKEWQRLPRQLVLEWCQKEKRPKPRITKTHCDVPGQYTCRIVLPDAKKADKDIILVPAEGFSTVQEAEQMAALLALAHIGPSLPRERVLPEPYASAWLSLSDSSKTPAVTQRRKFNTDAERKQSVLEKTRQASERRHKAASRSLNTLKRYAPLNMSDRNRNVVENILRAAALDDDTEDFATDVDKAALAQSLTDEEKAWAATVHAALKKQGFTGNDSQRGALYAVWQQRERQLHLAQEDSVGIGGMVKLNDVNLWDAVDWLVLHVPEHRLPEQYDPRGKQLEVVVPSEQEPAPTPQPQSQAQAAKADSVVHHNANSALLKEVTRLGFPVHASEAALEEVPADITLPARIRAAVLESLYLDLYQHLVPSLFDGDQAQEKKLGTAQDTKERTEEEIETLEAIYGEDFTRPQPNTYMIKLGVTVPGRDQPLKVTVEIILPSITGKPYPQGLPVFVLHSPLSVVSPNQNMIILQQLVLHSASLVGEVMVFECCEWLKSNWHAALEADMQHVPKWIQQLSEFGQDEDTAAPQAAAKRRQRGRQGAVSPLDVQKESARLLAEQQAKDSDKKYQSLQADRARLPARQFRDKILSLLEQNDVIVVSGETGCGKSTQIPQFILDHAIQTGQGATCNIICTQPRRISAVGLADRVSEERTEKVGRTVGYRIRLEAKVSSATRLTFVTTGILLRQLTSPEPLQGVSHIIVDEVHERSTEIDFLLLVLKQLLISRNSGKQNNVPGTQPRLKLVLMSATLNAELFSKYFSLDNSGSVDVAADSQHKGKRAKHKASGAPVVAMTGRTFPVQDFFLEDTLAAMEQSGMPYIPTAQAIRSAGAGRRGQGDASASAADSKSSQSKEAAPDDWDDDETLASHSALELTDEEASVRRNYPSCPPAVLKTLGLIDTAGRKNSGALRTNLELAEHTVYFILKKYSEGGILVFMPGLQEIRGLCDRLQRGMGQHGISKDSVWLIPLHSSLTTSNQQQVFARAPRGVRKIVVATNIAETSITVNDVMFVVESGKMKETQYDATRKMAMLVETWVSKANATQRKGRAGRVQSGYCFRLYSSKQHDEFPTHQLPEIHRTPLEHICLQIRLLGLGEAAHKAKAVPPSLAGVLSMTLEPPSDASIVSAITTLRELAALTRDEPERLTPLGYHLARLPVSNVRIGKMLIFGCILRCVDALTAIAALASDRTPFLSPADARDAAAEKHKAFRVPKSDHLTLLKAYEAWQAYKSEHGRYRAMEWCKDNFLQWRTLETVEGTARQFKDALVDIGFCARHRKGQSSSTDANANSSNAQVVLAAVTAGLYPNVLRVQHPPELFQKMINGYVPRENDAKALKYFASPRSVSHQQEDGDDSDSKDSRDSRDSRDSNRHRKPSGRVFLHPSSVNFTQNSFISPWLVYLQMMETHRVYVYDCSMAPPYALLLFGGEIEVDLENSLVVVDKWVKFRAAARVAVLIRGLRTELDALLERKIRNPSLSLADSPINQAIVELITSSGF